MTNLSTKIQKNKKGHSQISFSGKQRNGIPTFQLEDNRSEAIAQKNVQRLVNDSAHVKQLRATKEMITNHSALQRNENLEEELVQGKFTAQLAPEEEELMQGKLIQRAIDEEELMQGKFIQRAPEEDEELMQGKFTTQRVENKTGLPDQLKVGIENLSGKSLDHVNVHYNSPKPAAVQAHAYAQGSDIHLASGQDKHLPHEAWHVVQQMQGRVKPTTSVNGMAVNDSTGLEKEADMMGAKAL